MTEGIRWGGGDFALRAAVARCVLGENAEGERAELVRNHRRRRLLRLDLEPPGHPGGRSVMVKHFRTATGPWVERIKLWTGFSPARREWRALRRLRRAGVPVPEPLAWATLPDGDRLIVTRFVEGRPLGQDLPPAGKERRALLVALGRAVGDLHAAGFVHSDLHHGNVRVGERGPVLLDFQRTRRSRSTRARLRDLGFLDDSLANRASSADRVRLRAAALGLRRPFDARARKRLRRAGRAADRRARERAASRTRRALRPGRRFARMRLGKERGMRISEMGERTAAALCAAHRRAPAGDGARVLKDDGRSRITAVRCGEQRAVVKEVTGGGPQRRLANLFRGSPARRAWIGGHGLLSRGIGAARPLAFLERRRLGMPWSSLVVLEPLCADHAADLVGARGEEDAEALLDALLALVLRLHRWGARHGDLKASHVILSRKGEAWTSRLIDLEGVRFRRRISSAQRVFALAQLNASLPDAVPAAARRRCFGRYARALPFPGGSEAALKRIVEQSLARGHRWSGQGCALADYTRTRSQR